MIKRKLGREGLVVPAIGLGCMGMSPMFYGGAEEDKAIETLHAAIEYGMNLFDTSDMYGYGHNEELVGKVVRERRDEVVLASKFGFYFNSDGSRGICGRPEYVKEACDKSLQRLGVDSIDLYYLHRLDPEVPIEETVGAMAELVQEGKVRYLGLSEISPTTLRRAVNVHPISALQSEFSLWTREVEAEILPTCRELSVGLVPYSPVGRGMLAGKIKSFDDFAPNDSRYRLPRFMEGNLETNVRVCMEVDRLAEEKGVTPAQLSLAWILSHGDDIVPIPGTTKRDHIIENTGAVHVTITAEDKKRLESIASKIIGPRYDDERMQTVDVS